MKNKKSKACMKPYFLLRFYGQDEAHLFACESYELLAIQVSGFAAQPVDGQQSIEIPNMTVEVPEEGFGHPNMHYIVRAKK